MKRKKVTALLAVMAMTATLITGCGSSADTQDTAETPQAAEEASDKESTEAAETSGGAEAVTIWYYWETEGHQVALDQVIQEYNASQEDRKSTRLNSSH